MLCGSKAPDAPFFRPIGSLRTLAVLNRDSLYDDGETGFKMAWRVALASLSIRKEDTSSI